MNKQEFATRAADVLLFIASNNGCTQKDVLQSVYRNVADRNYGRQSPASFAIASLRSRGLLEDNCDRCPHCMRAARGNRNVELKITTAGKLAVRRIRRARKTA